MFISEHTSGKSVAYSSFKYEAGKYCIDVHEVAGEQGETWKPYLAQSYGAVYTTDAENADDDHKALEAIMGGGRMWGKPVLV